MEPSASNIVHYEMSYRIKNVSELIWVHPFLEPLPPGIEEGFC